MSLDHRKDSNVSGKSSKTRPLTNLAPAAVQEEEEEEQSVIEEDGEDAIWLDSFFLGGLKLFQIIIYLFFLIFWSNCIKKGP